MFFFVLVEELTLKSRGYRLWCVLNHLEVCADPWSPPTGVSHKVDLGHLEFFPGGSDSGGAKPSLLDSLLQKTGENQLII